MSQELLSGVGLAPAARIGLGDESALEWYFGPGEAVFHRSTFGASLERQDILGHLSRQCERCIGVGFTPEDLRRSTEALQKVSHLREPGDPEDRENRWLQWEDRVRSSEPRCHVCAGHGVIPVRQRVSKEALTARPRSQTREACGYEPPDGALRRYAVVSRRLDSVPRRSVRVLLAYYGDEGARWGRTRHGRIFSVYPLTKAAKGLLRNRAENPMNLSASERLGVEADLDKSQPKITRRQLLNAADEQARKAYEQACRDWNATSKKRLKIEMIEAA